MKLHDNWKLLYGGRELEAKVPGDVTLDLWRGGVIDDPYFGLNHKKLGWIIGEDFTYETAFDLPKDIFESQDIILSFDSIDTFSDIYLNGVKLGHTEDMFLGYRFSIKEIAKKKGNVLTVKLLSTGKVMDGIDDKGYFGTFNVKRLFIRKAQCHFGWDWAPDMPGYGICGDVQVLGLPTNRMEDVHYRAYNDGSVSLFADLTYTLRPQVDFNGKTVKESSPECREDKLRYTLAKRPNEPLTEKNALTQLLPVTGKKNFCNFRVEKPQLWYPRGYGEHPLYAYKVELIRHGQVIDSREGRLAFREIQLSQKPYDRDRMRYQLLVNGKEVFVRGSNWVPAECFIGAIEDEKYHRLITQAADANFNMLRVWGGGIYEKDIFYDICDEMGLMVWQDLMFACADIPEDDPAFVELTRKEITYQICRLRNHPSIVYWCGGNEKTGSYGLQICRGDYFVDVILRGLVANLDDSRPYARQSPCSLTDVGNDRSSGESHAGSFESSLGTGVEAYRDNVSGSAVSFVSECAIMGPGSLESFQKMFPQDKLWPINEYWDDRLMDNPYAAILMTFAKRQEFYADALYGKSESIQQFIPKAMTVHAETMRAEIEFARANPGCGGFMNWMYSDIWPSATWSVVDYYCEPKQVYYQMKRSYAPALVTFVQNESKQLQLTAINDGVKPLDTKITYGLRTLSGQTLWSESTQARCGSGEKWALDIRGEYDRQNCYLFAEYDLDGEKKSTVFSYSMWKNCCFESDYTMAVEEQEGRLAVTLTANRFAKGITLRLPDNCRYTYSDNYIDLQAGEEATVYVYGTQSGDGKRLQVTDFGSETV